MNGKKGNILNCLPAVFSVENEINPKRVFEFKKGISGEGAVIYFMERELRVADNFALLYAIQLAKKLKKNLKIVHVYNNFKYLPKKQFYDAELDILENDMIHYDLDFQVLEQKHFQSFVKCVSPAQIVIDFNPIRDNTILLDLNYKVTEIDSHNIVPARYISDKQEYSALQFRNRIYKNIYPFFTEFKDRFVSNSRAYEVLKKFIADKLDNYVQDKNNPNLDVISNLSPFINWGFISAQRVALEVYKSDASYENKEAFLEELIVRKELADNFCLYNKKFKNFMAAPDWAIKSLRKHKNDFRPTIYSIKELENAKTHDIVWNAAQNQLLTCGKIHGYLRMYWAKMLLQWTDSPHDAIDYAIYLNDKYAFDAPSANGYVGILWAIAGLHDRPFKEIYISGKIRKMSSKIILKKLKNGSYLEKFAMNN